MVRAIDGGEGGGIINVENCPGPAVAVMMKSRGNLIIKSWFLNYASTMGIRPIRVRILNKVTVGNSTVWAGCGPVAKNRCLI